MSNFSHIHRPTPWLKISFLFLICFHFFNCQKISNIHHFPHNAKWQNFKEGIDFVEIEKGQGDVSQKNHRIKVHFSAWYADAVLFDSSVKRKKPYAFVIGIGRVIQGWDEFLLNKTAGSKYYLKLKPEKAFGDGQSDQVRPFTTVIFSLEILP